MKKYLTILAFAAFGLSGAARANFEECKFYGHDDLLLCLQVHNRLSLLCLWAQ